MMLSLTNDIYISRNIGVACLPFIVVFSLCLIFVILCSHISPGSSWNKLTSIKSEIICDNGTHIFVNISKDVFTTMSNNYDENC